MKGFCPVHHTHLRTVVTDNPEQRRENFVVAPYALRSRDKSILQRMTAAARDIGLDQFGHCFERHRT